MGISDTLLGTPGTTQVHQTGAVRPPGYHMAQDVYATLERLLNSGVPFPTYQGQLDPGLSPTLQNAIRMAQGYASSSPQEALAGINGSIGRFMNPNYSNPSSGPPGGAMPFSGQFRPNTPAYNGRPIGGFDFKGGGSMQTGGPPQPPPWATGGPPRQGGVQTGFGPNPAAGGGGMSAGGAYAPQGPGKYNGPLGPGGGWGPAAGQPPPWMPPVGPPGGGMNKVGSAGPMPMIPAEQPYRPPVGTRPWQPNGPPPGWNPNMDPGFTELQWPGSGMPYGNDGRPVELQPAPMPYGDDQRINGQPPAQPGFPGGSLDAYLRSFLPGGGKPILAPSAPPGWTGYGTYPGGGSYGPNWTTNSVQMQGGGR